MTTPVLDLTEITESQASKYATHNGALRKLEALLVRILSRTTTAEPGSPSDGDVYLLPASPTGTNWSGNGNKLAHYNNAGWVFYTPFEGLSFWVNDEDVTITYDGSAWVADVWDFESAQQSMPTAATQVDTLAHGLGAIPKSVALFLQCQTAEHGYAIGDEIALGGSHYNYGNSQNNSVQCSCDATNIKARWVNGNAFYVFDGTATTAQLLTGVNWKYVMRAKL